MEHISERLPNGLRVIQLPMEAVRSVSLTVFVGVGSRYEDARMAGVSHVIEHMLFRGTPRRPNAAAISETLDSVGGLLNASTDKELTLYWAKVAEEHLPIAIDLLADMLLNSKLTPGELAKEKNLIIEELNMCADDPQDWVHVLADEALWPRQPVGREVAGTRESVIGLKRRDLRAFMRSYYGPNNTVVALAGGMEPRSTFDLITDRFDGWPAGKLVPPQPAFIPDGAPRYRVERKSTEQVNACLVYPAIPRAHPDRWPLDLLCTILGGGTSSRLFLQLRERLALAYDVHAYANHLSDTGSVVVYIGTDGRKMDVALEHILREIERLQRRRVSDGELQRAKQYFRGRLWLGLEDTHALASWFGAQEMLQDEVILPETVVDLVDGVTGDDLLRVARTYLQPSSARMAAVGPVTGLGLETRLAGA